MAELPRLRVGLTLDSATFIRETNKVIDGVNRMNREIASQNAIATRSFNTLSAATTFLKTSITGLVGSLGVGQITRFGREALDAAGNLGELAQQAGISTKELQSLQVAGLQVGVSQEQLVTALGQFGRRVGEAAKGNKEFKKTFAELGIAVTDGTDKVRDSFAVLEDLADAVQRAGSEQQRFTILADAFGARIGLKLLPLFKDGAAGLREWATAAERAGLILSAEFIAKADRASDALSTLQYALGKGFQIGVVEKFSGSVSDSADALVRAREAGQKLGEVVGTVLNGIATAAALLTPALDEIKREFELIAGAADLVKGALAGLGVATLSLDDINSRIADTNEQLAALGRKREELASLAQERGLAPESTQAIEELNKQNDALLKRRAELIAQRDALQGMTQAQDEATESNKPLGDSLGESAERAKELAKQLRLATAGEFLKGTSALEERFDNDAEAAKKSAEQIKKQYDELVEITDRVIKSGNQAIAQTAQAGKELNQSLDDQLSLQATLLSGVSAESEQYRIQVALLEAKRQRGKELTIDEQRKISLLQRQAIIIDRQEEARREFEQQAERSRALLEQPFINALENIQSAFADTFVDIFNGGVNSFAELAESIKQIFIRLAAEIAALMIIRPILANIAGVAGITGFGGLGGAAPSLATQLGFGGFTAGINRFGGGLGFAVPQTGPTITTPNRLGFLPGGQAQSLAPVGGAFPLSLAQTLGFGLAGGLGGAVVGSFFGGRGAIGGGLGGGVGAIGGGALGAAGLLGGSIGGPGGALIGGLGGALLGGFIGSLFGGGTSGNRANIQGGLGTAGAGGTGKAALFVRDFDQALIDMLDERQRKIADRLLKTAAGTAVKYDKELSEGDRARLAAGRIAPIAKGLGFRPGAIAGGGRTPEEQLARLAEALDIQEQVKDLVSGFGQFASQARELTRQFDDLNASAKEFGISRKGLATAEKKAGRELIEGELDRLTGTAPTVAERLKALNEQFLDVRRAAIQLGYPLEYVSRAYARARKELEKQIAAEREALRDRLQQFGGSTITGRFTALNQQFSELRKQAIQLGVPLEEVTKAYARARAELDKQVAAERNAIRARISQLAGSATFAQQMRELNYQFEELRASAKEYGISLKEVDEAQKQATKNLKEQQRAQENALALSVVEPFQQLLEPLQAFQTSLQFANLNPQQQYLAAQRDFQRTLNLAQAGSDIAISQLQAAGDLYIRTAEAVGASPAAVAARAEVQAGITSVITELNRAQAEASKGLETEIRRANREQVDTLKEHIQVSREALAELKRLRRS